MDKQTARLVLHCVEAGLEHWLERRAAEWQGLRRTVSMDWPNWPTISKERDLIGASARSLP